jgi:ferredoxin
MSAIKVDKSEIGKFIEKLSESGDEIWALQEEDGACEYRRLQDGQIPVLTCSNSRLSPKERVFPESERMFLYSTDREREDGFILKEAPNEDRGSVLLGIRPCDARSLTMLDNVFLKQGAAQDPYYLRKRQNTLLIGLGCSEPCSTCFCYWTGGGPFSTEGLDLLMTDLDDSYLVAPVSVKGESLVTELGLSAASQEDIQKADQIAQQALASMGDAADPSRIKDRPLQELFDDPYWDTAHETCIKCGVCTYLCPTCSCFDIQDEVCGSCGTRGRNWDTCMLSLITLHASGHNPRPTGKERFRQRFMHKLKYFQDDFDTLMCVGCGRCVQHCPVNIDIREIITALSAT